MDFPLRRETWAESEDDDPSVPWGSTEDQYNTALIMDALSFFLWLFLVLYLLLLKVGTAYLPFNKKFCYAVRFEKPDHNSCQKLPKKPKKA